MKREWHSESARLPPPPRDSLFTLHVLTLLNIAANIGGVVAILWALFHIVQPLVVPGVCVP